MNKNHAETVSGIRADLNNGLRKINEITPMTLADRLCLDAVKRDHQIRALNELLAIYKAPDQSLIDEYLNEKNGSAFNDPSERTQESAAAHFAEYAEDEERNLQRLLTERELLIGYINADEQMLIKYNDFRGRFPTP